ncbi:MAG: phosphatase PAP2 family protein [Chloroflexi bacterium]|nr:phosphatase PAP2 family protein [Chloroflexota bacterium]
MSRELAIIAGCYLVFALAKNLTDPSPVLRAVSNGWNLIRLEDALALNHESVIQQLVGGFSLGFLIALTYFYAVGMWLGLIGIAAILFIKNRAAYILLRRTFVVTMVLGAIIFAVFPLAPPRFMPGYGMTDTVTLLGLDPAPHSDSAISYNRFAAMPSLHYTWALLVMVGAFKLGWGWAKLTGIAFQALMFVAIIATANHYVLDAFAGAALLLIALYFTSQWIRHDRIIKHWVNRELHSLKEVEASWRKRASLIEWPDLRQQFLSGFIIRGGHDIRP